MKEKEKKLICLIMHIYMYTEEEWMLLETKIPEVENSSK